MAPQAERAEQAQPVNKTIYLPKEVFEAAMSMLLPRQTFSNLMQNLILQELMRRQKQLEPQINTDKHRFPLRPFEFEEETR